MERDSGGGGAPELGRAAESPGKVAVTPAPRAVFSNLFRIELPPGGFEVALVLCHETGHRIGAVRQLRWSDIDFESDSIRWRGDTEKTGYEHETPMTSEARSILLKARSESPGIGDAPVLPAPQDPSRCVSRHLARDWWRKAEKKADLEPRRGRGYHSLRRKFASELIRQPTKVLCEPGGWKEPMTIMKCYQHPDQEQLREALSDRRRAVNGPEQRE